jgi:hypothetical protein
MRGPGLDQLSIAGGYQQVEQQAWETGTVGGTARFNARRVP